MLAWFSKKKKENAIIRQKGNVCLNCQTILNGEENFCPNCGQRNNINPLNFKIVIDEFFGNLFAYDSRLWRTLIPLLISPGKTAYQYIYGKRQHFVNPFRIYLAISLIFFVFIGIIDTIVSIENEDKFTLHLVKTDSTGLYKIYKGPQLNSFNDSLATSLKNTPGFRKKVQILFQYHRHNPPQSTKEVFETLHLPPTFWNRFIQDKILNFTKILEGESQFEKKLFSGLSLTIFLLLPLFAIVLKLLYIRRKYSYMEHLVFVFYTQSVFFLFLLLFTLIYYGFGQHSYVYLLFLFLFGIYLYLAMRRFYNQGIVKTWIKFSIANMAFLFILGVGIFVLTIISFILY
ncbi:DUF3667 domain-containing protein [Flavobacteriaceae bacterium F08102]|nr:DUF3667 domain-containing protein [Flavobacteriaceae bacterium F08102]